MTQFYNRVFNSLNGDVPVTIEVRDGRAYVYVPQLSEPIVVVNKFPIKLAFGTLVREFAITRAVPLQLTCTRIQEPDNEPR